MVEGQAYAGDVRKVGRDVAASDLDEPVLHVLRVDELDLLENPELLQEGSTHQPVEVAAGNKSRPLGGLCCHRCFAPLAWTSRGLVGSSAPDPEPRIIPCVVVRTGRMERTSALRPAVTSEVDLPVGEW